MSETQAVLLSQTGKLTREQLALVATPAGTATHRPVPHADVVTALVDTLALRHIAPVREEYAVSKDGTKMFGIVEIETTFQGCRFAIGIRNAHDKSMRLAPTFFRSSQVSSSKRTLRSNHEVSFPVRGLIRATQLFTFAQTSPFTHCSAFRPCTGLRLTSTTRIDPIFFSVLGSQN